VAYFKALPRNLSSGTHENLELLRLTVIRPEVLTRDLFLIKSRQATNLLTATFERFASGGM